jgi:starch synthase
MGELRVLFATAELVPLARVGGLAAATAGLAKALRELGVSLEIVLPDYFATPLEGEERIELDVPHWAGPAVARRGVADGVGQVTLIRASGVARSHPYLQPDGTGWPDNDHRFVSFSAGVAALTRATAPDVLHLNDWHTATTLAFLEDRPPTVLTIHTLGYQGHSHEGWIQAFPHHAGAYAWGGAANPLAGAIRLADLVVAVSPTYAQEILTPEGGAGLDPLLQAKGDRLVGILNGIDTGVWDPASDPHLGTTYSAAKPGGKADARKALAKELGLERDAGPLAVMITRLVDQKGVDLLLPLEPYLSTLPMRLAVLGDGDRDLVEALHALAARHPGTVAFRHGYDEGLAHRLFAGGDLILMPSRFEPCGLAQMQAMRYGTLPVATDVGGLHDTIVDADADPATPPVCSPGTCRRCRCSTPSTARCVRGATAHVARR